MMPETKFTPEFIQELKENIKKAHKVGFAKNEKEIDVIRQAERDAFQYYPDALDEIERLQKQLEANEKLFMAENQGMLLMNIHRLWPREYVVRFATHLLGTECQECMAKKMEEENAQ